MTKIRVYKKPSRAIVDDQDFPDDEYRFPTAAYFVIAEDPAMDFAFQDAEAIGIYSEEK